MATAAITNTFVNGTPADATEVNANFGDLVTFLNDDVVHVDGTKAMTGSLDLGSNKILSLATPTVSTDGVNKSYVDNHTDYDVGSGVTLTTGGATVAPLSVTAPAAGLALVACAGTVTTSGVTYGGGDSVTVTLDITSVTSLGTVKGTNTLGVFGANGTSSPQVIVFLVVLAAGVNTITVTGTRTNSGASGGTVTADSGFKCAVLMGGFA